MAKKPKAEVKVEPTIQTEDGAILDVDNLPEMRTVGVVQAHPGSSEWVSVVLTTKGTKVLKVECEEPNMRQIAIDTAKINFVKMFYGDVLA